MSTLRDGRQLVTELLVGFALLLGATSAPAIWFFEVSFQLAGTYASREDYRAATAAAVTGAVLLVVATLVLWPRLTTWFSRSVALGGIAVQVLLAGSGWAQAAAAPPARWGATTPAEAVGQTLMMPMSWPLELALLGVAGHSLLRLLDPGLRGRWSPSRR